MGSIIVLGLASVHAAKKYILPNKIVVYYYSTESGKWDKDDVVKYKYDKKGNIKYEKSDMLFAREQNIKNTYKNDKLRKATGGNFSVTLDWEKNQKL